MLREGDAFAVAIDCFAHISESYDIVAGVEARGFIFAAAVGALTGKGFVPIRKSGKLPADSYSHSYGLEYGEATLQVHKDAFKVGERVLLIDDVLATGGTLGAATVLIEKCGAVLDSIGVLIEIPGLGGQENYHASGSGIPISVLL